MQKDEILLPHILYETHLKEIGGVKFTPREVSLIACFVSGRSAKTIAAFLSIAPKTVETHTHNIMIKLGCNSRERVINFIERSGQYKNVKAYYSSFLIHMAFEKVLREIRKQLQEEKNCFLVCKSELTSPLLQQLKQDLKGAGVNASIQRHTPTKQSDHVIPFEIKSNQIIIGDKSYPYYTAVFEVLKKVYPKLNLKSHMAEFNQQIEGMEQGLLATGNRNSREQSYPVFLLFKYRYIVAGFLSFLILASILLFQTTDITKETNSVISDLPLPNESSLLHRPQLLQAIDEKLKGQKGIQTVALMGVGGAGKTTLARHYARNQRLPIVWEINAETKESLLRSFETLAYALARTQKERDEVRSIQKIMNVNERESQLLHFVKVRLKSSSDWLLIYDNVDTFANIHHYFPHDPMVWGKGRVIITTRDSNIKTNCHIRNNKVIPIEQLSTAELEKLFTKIISAEGNVRLTKVQTDQRKRFLAGLPPFPLDVAIAAYCLRETKLSQNEYLKHLVHNNKELTAVQEAILKDVDNYTQTRYAIIVTSIKQLIKQHSDFKELLLFISLINSQNIPRELLNRSKDKMVVENFVRSLKRYSLIINKDAQACKQELEFSIHRSTQEIILAYLNENLQASEQQVFYKLADAIKNYAEYVMYRYNIPDMRILEEHGRSFLGHRKLFSQYVSGIVEGELGRIYFYFGDYSKAEEFLKRSIAAYKQVHGQNHPKIARKFLLLGYVYKDAGNYTLARKAFEKAFLVFQRTLGDNHIDTTMALTFLGVIHMYSGQYHKATELLEKECVIYNGYYNDCDIETSWTAIKLGNLYKCLGKHEHAKNLLEKAFAAYKKFYGENHVEFAWAMMRLGKINQDLGNIEEAKTLLERGYKIYLKHYGDRHIETARAAIYMADIYRVTGKLKKTKDLLKRNLPIFEKHYGTEHIETAWVLQKFGKLYILEGYLKEAEKALHKALTIYRQSNHPRSHRPLESLTDLYLALSDKAIVQGNPIQSQQYKNQAVDFITQAQMVAHNSFPAGSAHIQRIQSKLDKIIH